jgi:hypothetical protein
MRLLPHFAMLLLRSLPALFRGRANQAMVELALRQQLATYSYKGSRPRITSLDRAFWVVLSRLWPRWKDVLCIVKPDTVVRWHRKGLLLYWRAISRPGPGRPQISEEIQELILRLATENPWRARKIQAELAKLGFTVSLATVSRYLPKRKLDDGQRQRWKTFLRNHRGVIAGMDFFVVPTVRFRLLYAWFAIVHGRRRVLHFNVTSNPTSAWVVQQLREAFPREPALRYLIYDNDSIFSREVTEAIERFQLVPRRTAYRSPWRRVGCWRGAGRWRLSVAPRFRWECLTSATLGPFPAPARRTVRADFPHTALVQALMTSPSAGRRVASAA